MEAGAGGGEAGGGEAGGGEAGGGGWTHVPSSACRIHPASHCTAPGQGEQPYLRRHRCRVRLRRERRGPAGLDDLRCPGAIPTPTSAPCWHLPSTQELIQGQDACLWREWGTAEAERTVYARGGVPSGFTFRPLIWAISATQRTGARKIRYLYRIPAPPHTLALPAPGHHADLLRVRALPVAIRRQALQRQHLSPRDRYAGGCFRVMTHVHVHVPPHGGKPRPRWNPWFQPCRSTSAA